MEEVIDREQLITVALKYGTQVKPLKVVAFAQLTAKALFLSKQPLCIDELKKQVAFILGIKDVDERFVKEALAYLTELGKVKEVSQGWILRPEEFKEINRATHKSREALIELLKRHFPTEKIDRKRLKRWFNDTISNFFAHLGDSWIISISKGKKAQPKQIALSEILKKTISDNGLTLYESDLVHGFDNFMHSDSLLDQKYILYVSQAMFAARLVAADIGVDPLSLDELKNTILILDTNVIFAIMLEAHKLAPSLGKLENAFRSVGIHVRYLHSTKEEYERALAGKRQEILGLLPIFKSDVISEVKDDFISTAMVRKCRTSADYETFFDSLNDLPDSLEGGYEIKLLDDEFIMQQINQASKDARLKTIIQKYAKLMRKWGPKSEASLCHDASLISVTERLRAEHEKCWVLSLDRSLLAADSHRSGASGLPNVLSIAVLIEILAINNAGPELSANDIAPLLSSMIANESTPSENSKIAYTLSDLKILHTINESAADLPTEDIQSIARQISKARAEGKDASSVDLQIKVNRLCQSRREDLDERLKVARRSEQNALEQAKDEADKRKHLENEISSLRSKQDREKDIWKVFKTLIGLVFLAAFISWALWKYGQVLYCNILDCTSHEAVIRDILDYGWPVIWLFVIVPIYRNVKKLWDLCRTEKGSID